MKKLLQLELLLAIAVIAMVFVFKSQKNTNRQPPVQLKPYEQLFIMKNYPDYKPDVQKYMSEVKNVSSQLKQDYQKSGKDIPQWITQGPYNVSGRINTIAVNPDNNNEIYVGSTCGGVFKTTDGGNNWESVFDDNPFLTISCITLSPHNSAHVFVGTGDPNISGYPFVGDGIYKSINSGQTWIHLGLENVGIVTKIVINPNDENIIYAATMGIPFEKNENRGLYKTTDGGQTWNKVLYLSNDAGIIDMVMLPDNPDTLFVAGWNRIRNYFLNEISGSESKIYRTFDGGETWVTLTNNLPQQDMTRIGLCLSLQDTVKIVAQIINPNYFETEGIYSTSDFGESWEKFDAGGLESALGGFGWYFGQVRVNPWNKNQMFILGVDLYRSDDGGKNFDVTTSYYEVHADKHDLVFVDSSTILLATDGGLYKSTNGGHNWSDIENLPITQFYRIAVDPFHNGMYAGGAQDNGTNYGNRIDSVNWAHILGGDGFQPLFDWENETYVYGETQNGALYKGVRSSGYIQWDNFSAGIPQEDRRAWDMPICMSKQHSNILYTGTYRVYKNSSAPESSWEAISDDLTNGTESHYNIISSIDVSPLNDTLVISGSSDGRVNVFDGNNWVNITEGLPDRYVTCVRMSPNDTNDIFVSHSGYKANDNTPLIHFSDDFGNTWQDISGNLPQFAVNSIFVLNGYDDSVIFIGTDGGVYHTLNRGQNWERTGTGMPVIQIFDLAYDDTNHILAVGTFARSLMTIELESIVKKYNPVVDNIKFETIEASVYPNPATDFINIKFGKTINNGNLIINDIQGKILFTERLINANDITVNISDFKKGLYIISVNKNNKNIVKQKILKQ
jgi:photosystem II stability/assembly factor-like uncharacterized protein